MTTAPHPLPAAPAPIPGVELSATLLRLRAVGLEVARRRIAAMRPERGATPAGRARGAALQRTVSCRTALVWIALALAFAAGYGYWAETASLSDNLAAALQRTR